MEDLTGRVMPSLVPSSMHGGNTTADDRRYSLSAPGSPSVLAVPDVLDNLPLPQPTGPQLPVGHPGQQESVRVQAADDGGGRWTPADNIPAASYWTETP
jgi:hypothetical protein